MRQFALSLFIAACVAGCVASETAPISATTRVDPPPLAPAQLACATDADCTLVFRRCGSCDCGAPLARAAVPVATAERERRCRDEIAPQCEMQCPATLPRCQAGQCVLQPANGAPPPEPFR